MVSPVTHSEATVRVSQGPVVKRPTLKIRTKTNREKLEASVLYTSKTLKLLFKARLCIFRVVPS